MKKISLLALIVLAALEVQAQPSTNSPAVRLAWDLVNNPIVNGYAVYYGISSGQYTNRTVVTPQSNTSLAISNLVRGTTYYFAATSLATNGLESLYSVEISYATVPLPPRPTVTLDVLRP